MHKRLVCLPVCLADWLCLFFSLSTSRGLSLSVFNNFSLCLMFFSPVLSLSQFVSWFVFQLVFGIVSQFVYWLIICLSLKPPCKLLKPSVLVGRSVVLSFFGIYSQFLHQCPCPNGWKAFFLLLLPTACVSGQPSPSSALQVFFKRIPGKKTAVFY